MKILEDDIYSFGFIMLDSLLNPSVTLKKNEFLLKDLVSPLSSIADYFTPLFLVLKQKQ